MKLSLRILASLMALLLIMGLAACGNTEDPQSSSAPESSETSEPVSDESSEPNAPESSEPEAPESSEPEEPESSEPEEPNNPVEVDKTTTTGTKDNGEKTTVPTKSSRTKTTRTTTATKTEKPTTTATQKETSLTWAQVKKNIPNSAKGKTLVVYDWNPESEVPGLAQVNKNFKKETGINVDYKIVNYGDYFTKITAQVAANNPPDAVRLQFINRSNLASLQPFNNTGYNFNDTYWDDFVLDAYTFNGNIYGINMVDSPYVCPAIMYYNKNLIDTYNLDDPYELWKDGKWTWDKVWEMCEEFVDEADGDVTGLTDMAFEELGVAEGLLMVSLDSKNDKVVSNLGNKNYIKAWETYADKYDKGLVAQSFTDNDAFDKGNILFNLSMQIASRSGSSYFMRLRKQNAVSCVPFPAKKEGAKAYQLMGEMQAMGIPKGAKNADLVPYYARYYYDVKNYDMDNFFNVDHAAEVTEYIMESDPLISCGSIILSTNVGIGQGVLQDTLKQGGKENVKMTIDSVVPMLDMAVADFNSFLAGL